MVLVYNYRLQEYNNYYRGVVLDYKFHESSYGPHLIREPVIIKDKNNNHSSTVIHRTKKDVQDRLGGPIPYVEGNDE